MLDVEVLTPEGEIFRGEVRQLSTRTEVGEIGILANHAVCNSGRCRSYNNHHLIL